MDRSELWAQRDEKRMREEPDRETEWLLKQLLVKAENPADNIEIENQVRVVKQKLLNDEKYRVLLETVLERYIHERLGFVLPAVLAKQEDFYYQFV